MLGFKGNQDLNIPEKSDKLTEDIKKQSVNLIEIEERREHFVKEIILGAIGDKMKDISADILAAEAESRSARKTILKLVQDEICTAINGDLTVINYSQKAKAEQDVYLFDGSQWVELEHQLYFDFIDNCCKKCGVPSRYVGEPAFQNDLCERVARSIAKFRNPYIPRDEVWVNMKNGTLVVDSEGNRTLRAHNRDDFFTYNVGYAYDEKAECSLWHQFLDKVLPDKEAQRALAEYIAYCFTDTLNLEKMLVLYGFGSNGKSVVLDTIESIVGSENVSNVTLAELTKDDEKRSQIEYKRVNISHESDDDLQASTLKSIVSNEPVSVRKLYVGSHKMTRYAKLITSFNALPRAEHTNGFYRRFWILLFNVTITEEEADTDLAKKLRKELSGIMNWVLDAMQNILKQRSFSPCKMCEEALFKYKTASDSTFLFFTQACEISDTLTTHGPTLYKNYKDFCIEEGINFVGKNKFFERFSQIKGVERTEQQRTIFFNVKLKASSNGCPF